MTASRAILCILLAVLVGCGSGTRTVRRAAKPRPAAPGGVYHEVQPGETMYSISKRYGVKVDALGAANDITDPTQLHVGRRLRIPGGGGAEPTAPAPEAPRTSPRPDLLEEEPPAHLSAEELLKGYKFEEAKPEAAQAPEPTPSGPGKYAGRFIWPLGAKKILSGFGMRDGAMHNGLDLGAPEGTPVRAAAAGTVIYEGDGLSGYGNMVILDHGGGYTTIYAHNADNKVELGRKVKQGQVIALVGDTGRATAPHCHFEIRLKTRALNPLDYLP